MEKMEKLNYESPSVEILEVVQKGVICVSDTVTKGTPTFNGFDTETEEW